MKYLAILFALFLVGCNCNKTVSQTKQKPQLIVPEEVAKRSSHPSYHVYRIEVPDGWLVVYDGIESGGITFYRDFDHDWELE